MESVEKFKVGQVVRLRSGGPDMTVTSMQAGAVSVIWFYLGTDNRWMTQTNSFPEDWLSFLK